MRSLRFVAALAISAQALIAQQPAGRNSLSLDEAISIARLNNPNFLTTQNNVRVATSGFVRPIRRSCHRSRRASRRAISRPVPSSSRAWPSAASGDTYQSSYRLGLNYFITGAVAFAPRAGARQPRRPRRPTSSARRKPRARS